MPAPGRVEGNDEMLAPPGRLLNPDPGRGPGVGKVPNDGRVFAICPPPMPLPPVGRRLTFAGTDGRDIVGVRAAAPLYPPPGRESPPPPTRPAPPARAPPPP